VKVAVFAYSKNNILDGIVKLFLNEKNNVKSVVVNPNSYNSVLSNHSKKPS
jgi:hypothetical protein